MFKLPNEGIASRFIFLSIALELEVTSSGDVRLKPAPDAGLDKAAFLGRLDALHAKEPVGAPMVETMRREARY